MKKLFLTTSLIGFLAITALASSRKHTILSDDISLPNKAYTALFKEETTTLTKSKKFLVKTFKVRGVLKTSFYNLENELIATTYNANSEVLPAAGLKNLNKDYSAYAIQEVIVYQGSDLESNPLPYDNSEKSDTMYFVHLTSEKENILVRMSPAGSVYFFKKL